MLRDQQYLTRLGLALAGLLITALLLIGFLPILGGLFGLLTMLFVTVIITLLISPLANRLEERRVPRVVTVIGVYAAIALVSGVVVFLVLGPLLNGLSRLTAQSDEEIAQLIAGLEQIVGPIIAEPVVSQRASLTLLLSQAAGTLLRAILSLGGLFLNLLIIGVLVLFLVSDRTIGTSLLRTAVPPQHRPRIARVTVNIGRGLGRWMVAQLGISAYYTVTYIVVNLVLGVPYAVPIGVVSGLLEFIPYLGNIVGNILTTAAALTVSPLTALLAWLGSMVFGIIGGNIIAPYLLSRAARVHPVTVIVALMIGNLIGGVLGILLAMPVVVIIVILIDELHTTRADETPLPTGAEALAAGRAAVGYLVGDERAEKPGD
ncbi:MAG: AI-2E family transporter [Chloroflexi bacterium]|nr:AI-2E family transporter [Chloroflexota bacterium]